MARGYMGKMLMINLSNGVIKEAKLDEIIGRLFIGGYGLGARIIYSQHLSHITTCHIFPPCFLILNPEIRL